MTKPPEDRRKIVNARLPKLVISALERSASENGTTLTDEIEARLVQTLMSDGVLDRESATRVCGEYAAASAALH